MKLSIYLLSGPLSQEAITLAQKFQRLFPPAHLSRIQEGVYASKLENVQITLFRDLAQLQRRVPMNFVRKAAFADVFCSELIRLDYPRPFAVTLAKLVARQIASSQLRPQQKQPL